MKKSLEISNGIALIITIIINYVSNTGILNGNTMAIISAKYQNYFTPAGYAFSIWGLIYIGLFAFIIYGAKGLFVEKPRHEVIVQKIGWWFLISCIANSLWVFAWLYEFIGISVIIMSILLLSLFKILGILRAHQLPKSMAEIWCIYFPFSIYAGWISVAFFADLSAFYTKINENIFGLSDINMSISFIIIAAVLHVYMVWKQNSYAFSFVGIWALIAIAVANWTENQTIVYASLIAASIIFISILLHFFLSKKSSSNQTEFSYK